MAEKRLSAGVVVVRNVSGDWLCLVLRAYRNWGFPKGLCERGEEPLQTAVREVAEEAGLTDLQFRFGEEFRETEPYAGGKVARYYVAESATGEARLPVSPELGRPEHHEFRWARFDAARRLLPPRLQLILDWAQSIVGPGT